MDGVKISKKTIQQDGVAKDDLNGWVDYLRWLGVKVEEPGAEKFENETSY